MASRTADDRLFPIRVFVGAVVLVCLALAVSALLSYSSMTELRSVYLEEKAHEISTVLTERLRGPDRWNPEAWRPIMDEARQSGSYPWLRSLVLLDENGRTLVKSGQESSDLYLNESAVRAPRWGRPGGRFGRSSPRQGGEGEQPTRLSLRIGIDRSVAWFITRQAYVHLVVSALAIVALSVLAYFFVRTLRSFLNLQRQEEAQRHLAALGRLSATLAHEIRNPLGAIKGLTQVAQERLPRDHDTQELMTTVVTEAERLERLVTDLLTFARPRPMSSVELDLKHLAAEVVEGLRSQTADKNLTFQLSDPEPPAVVLADPDGLRQVLLNLFLNAIEASPRDSTIEVKIEASERSHLVEVCDEGTGIGDQNAEELFQPFVTTKTRGTGLGLPVSRQIVERLEGSIELRNREPKGAVCRLTLPAHTSSSAAASKPVASASGGRV